MKKTITTLFALLTLASSMANAAGKDDLWESKISIEGMEMMGMAIPSQQICTKAGRSVDPNDAMKGQDNCSVSDYKSSGSKSSWKFKCTGSEPMSGSADMNATANEYTIKMKTQSSQGNMNMTANGKKIGTCNYETDSPEAKACNQIGQSSAEIKKQQAQECKAALADNKYGSFLKLDTGSQDVMIGNKNCGGKVEAGCAELRPQMCDKVSKAMKDFDSDAGYATIASKPEAIKLAGECGLAWEKTSKAYCSKQLSSKNYARVADFCESDAKPLYAQYCAGRSYTAQNDTPYRAICSKYGHGSYSDSDSVSSNTSNSTSKSATGNTDSTSGKDNPSKAILDGAKKLKDAFGIGF
ncbi:MAG: DUF3617 domain-containing protein [Methylophilaceae bacterium]|nr:DUF3617 family protein [Methyloradius sp.]